MAEKQPASEKGSKSSSTATTKTTATQQPTKKKRGTLQGFFGDYVAEVGGKYYYHRDAATVRRLDKAKLIYYKDEADAKRAGKKPAPELKATTGDLASAEAAFQRGQSYISKHLALTSKERDELYKKAFVALPESMRDYRSYLEKNE